jgi:hypothetical protein
MKSTNTKVNRTFGALAVELHDLPDKRIKIIHKIINDGRDGYSFDFVSNVNTYRSLLGSGLVSVKW